MPCKLGKLKDLSKFDAEFFGFQAHRVNVMDPMARMILEKAYEAIIDSGWHLNRSFVVDRVMCLCRFHSGSVVLMYDRLAYLSVYYLKIIIHVCCVLRK